MDEKILKNKKIIIELGCGNGASKDILQNKKVILTDVEIFLDIKKIDMTKLNLEKIFKKVDIFIINHTLHHCP